MKKVILLFLLFCVIIENANTQELFETGDIIYPDSISGIEVRSASSMSDYQIRIPITIPSSPETASLMKFVDCPIDYSMGIPDIQIPIYQVQSGEISLPISLSYHASGVKVSDIASAVGLGWTLNAGGFITQQILGEIDNTAQTKFGFYKSHEEIAAAIGKADPNNQSNLYSRMKEFIDNINYMLNKPPQSVPVELHSDRYVYSFGEHSGVFRYKYGTKELYTIPYDPIKIVSVTNVVDKKGNTYYFDRCDTSETESQTFTPNTYKQDWRIIPDNIYNLNSRTWRLTKVVSANRCDSIELEYTGYSVISYSVDQTIESGQDPVYISADGGCLSYNVPEDNYQGCHCHRVMGGKMYRPLNHVTYNTHSFGNSCVSEIKVNGRKIVDFIYGDDREDAGNSNNKAKKLDRIKVYLDDLTKEYVFNYSYSGDSRISPRLMLNKLELTTESSEEKEVYLFKYNSQDLPPYCTSSRNFDSHLFYEDYWGYYNGSASSNKVVNSGNYPSNREPNLK